MRIDITVQCAFCKRPLDDKVNVSPAGDTTFITVEVTPCSNCIDEAMSNGMKAVKQKYASNYEPQGEDPN